MKLFDIISEIQYSMYQGTVRITHSKDINVQDVSELFRALPGVVTVTQLSHDSERHTATMKMKKKMLKKETIKKSETWMLTI